MESVREGMTVYSADGRRLGKIVSREEDNLLIEKGLFFKRDYVAHYEDVDRVQGDDVYLRVDARQLEERQAAAEAGERQREPEIERPAERLDEGAFAGAGTAAGAGAAAAGESGARAQTQPEADVIVLVEEEVVQDETGEEIAGAVRAVVVPVGTEPQAEQRAAAGEPGEGEEERRTAGGDRPRGTEEDPNTRR